MLQEISYFLIFGKPLILYLGFIAVVLILGTAAIPLLRKRAVNIPFVWHKRLAAAAVAFALLHGFLGILANF